MTRCLSTRQVEHYAEKGFVSPITAFSAGQAAACRSRLEAMERADGGIAPDRRRKMHLYLEWVDEIVHHPRILDAVEDLIGPDILLYHLTLWVKEPGSDARISWHQDSTYFGLSPALHVTAWVALSASDLRSGCVQVVPGSHRAGQVPHAMTHQQDNLLPKGQEIDVAPDAPVESMVLQPGEFSLHHTHLHHCSLPNRSDDRRIGLGVSYIPARCRCSARQRLTAMRVRGEDRHHHFDAEERPRRDLDPDGLVRHADAMARWHRAREQLFAEAHGGSA